MPPYFIHVRNVEYEPSPSGHGLPELQVENGRMRFFRAKRRKASAVTAVEHFHAEHVPIEVHGRMHVRNPKRDRRNPLHRYSHTARVYSRRWPAAGLTQGALKEDTFLSAKNHNLPTSVVA